MFPCIPRLVLVAAIYCGLFGLQQAAAAEVPKLPAATKTRVQFSRDVEPILSSRCHACHGPQQQMNGLRLDRQEDALRGGYSGPVILPGNSANSKLIHLVAGVREDLVMPPVGERLTAREIAVLRAWIDQGAEWPQGETAVATADKAASEKVEHWSFHPLRRPPLPAVRNRAWVRNPIDAFVLAKLETEGIEPSPEADKATQIRRLSLDLIGLPPSPEEVAEFLSHKGPGAYERLVDQLLDSPHHGEKWAQHWLDLARYADSDGYEQDLPRPHAWRYRHWVIKALNRDMPFDQFTIEQIAGDLLPQATVEQKVATGFQRNNLKNREAGVNLKQFRFEEVVDRTNTVGTVWLGVTVGCAQCHDHKYDPLFQKDYYRLLAFFNNLEEVIIEAPLAGEWGPYLQALPEYDRKRRQLLAQYNVPQLQPPWEARLLEAKAHPGKWPDWDVTHINMRVNIDGTDRILETDPARRSQREAYLVTKFFIKNYRRVLSRERYQELGFEELLEKLDELDASFPALSQARGVAENPNAGKTHIHIRGQWDRPGIEVEPGTPDFLSASTLQGKPTRLDLARWLVSGENPLTARVTVNRIWQEHFGRGLVVTSDNFGAQGEPPSHPALLDWLGSEFIGRGWSLKQLHKLIVMSATYRQSSHVGPEWLSRDPNNALLARQSRLRLPAESIRDSALAVSGLLNPAIGGKSVRPPLPGEVAKLGYGNGIEWKDSQGQDRYRRGLYTHFQRSVPYPFLMNFDTPDRSTTACRRERSNTPLQALNLLNDPVFYEAAQALAARILQQARSGDFLPALDYAFRLCLARRPTVREQEQLSGYFHQQKQMLEQYVGATEALFPPKLEGVERTQAAAWVGLSRILLNLDEFITRE